MTDKEREIIAGDEIKAILEKWGCTLTVGKPLVEAQGDVYIIRAAQVITVQAVPGWVPVERPTLE